MVLYYNYQGGTRGRGGFFEGAGGNLEMTGLVSGFGGDIYNEWPVKVLFPFNLI